MSGHSKWANIKHRKAKQDAQKGKIFTKMGKEIIVAVKQGGGGDPDANARLKTVIQKARSYNMPMENITRVIQKATGDLAGVNYEELVYEGYGPGGTAVMIEIMTDNRNRTAGDIRHLFSKHGGNLGETGCVSWMFNKVGVITFDKESLNVDADEIMMVALEAGAEDMKEDEESIEIICTPEDVEEVEKSIRDANYVPIMVEVTMLPQNTIHLDGDDASKMLKLMDALEEHDDVQEVYSNFDIDDEIIDD